MYCRFFVELEVGCYHMTCRCGHEFCYLCTSRWKTCSCPQWDEGRLLQQARRQVEVQVSQLLPQWLCVHPPRQLLLLVIDMGAAEQAHNDTGNATHACWIACLRAVWRSSYMIGYKI